MSVIVVPSIHTLTRCTVVFKELVQTNEKNHPDYDDINNRNKRIKVKSKSDCDIHTLIPVRMCNTNCWLCERVTRVVCINLVVVIFICWQTIQLFVYTLIVNRIMYHFMWTISTQHWYHRTVSECRKDTEWIETNDNTIQLLRLLSVAHVTTQTISI